MKKIINLYLLVLSYSFYFAQNNSVEYLVEKDGMKQLFTLDITKNKSLFYSNEYCKPGEDEIFNYVIVETSEKGNYIFHDQIETLRVYYKQELTLKWELHNETKTLNNIVLQKATTTYKDKQWTAWYNSNIPLNSGPFIFGNLPGLIYEVNTNNFNITLTSIENKNKNCVKISSKEKPIDRESYTKYNKELLEILKAGYEKRTNVFDNMTMQSLFENSIKKDLFRAYF